MLVCKHKFYNLKIIGIEGGKCIVLLQLIILHCAAKLKVMVTKYCQGYKIEKEKIGSACSMQGRFHYHMLCRSETLNGTENVTQIIVHYSMEGIG